MQIAGSETLMSPPARAEVSGKKTKKSLRRHSGYPDTIDSIPIDTGRRIKRRGFVQLALSVMRPAPWACRGDGYSRTTDKTLYVFETSYKRLFDKA